MLANSVDRDWNIFYLEKEKTGKERRGKENLIARKVVFFGQEDCWRISATSADVWQNHRGIISPHLPLSTTVTVTSLPGLLLLSLPHLLPLFFSRVKHKKCGSQSNSINSGLSPYSLRFSFFLAPSSSAPFSHLLPPFPLSPVIVYPDNLTAASFHSNQCSLLTFPFLGRVSSNWKMSNSMSSKSSGFSSVRKLFFEKVLSLQLITPSRKDVGKAVDFSDCWPPFAAGCWFGVQRWLLCSNCWLEVWLLMNNPLKIFHPLKFWNFKMLKSEKSKCQTPKSGAVLGLAKN